MEALSLNWQRSRVISDSTTEQIKFKPKERNVQVRVSESNV